MARERSLLALVLVCVLVHASHHFALGQTTMAEIVISPEAQTDVQIGDTVLFTCVAFGDSVSTISWSRGGNALLNDSQRITIYEEEFAEGGVTFVQSILEICSVGLGDTTEGYSCSAGSGADIDSATFELNTQQIVIYPEDTEMIAGDTVLLTCVSYLSPVTWSREGVELVNDSMRITVYQEQFVESELSFYLSILEICSTESSDSGTYSCNADEGDGANSSISFQLTVQTPPQIVLYPVDPTDVPVGDTVLLTCVANGDLPLSISWSREGTVLMNDSQRITIYEEEIEEGGITFLQSILQICSIGSDDAGVYSCITENDASNDTASFELTVAGPPVQIVLHPVNLTDVPDGDTVLLTCVANGDLPLSISWSREGTVLMNDSQRITIYEEEIEEGGITFLQSILQICSARADDAGTYSCIAENEAGNDTANFQLNVVPPEVAVQIVLHPVDLTDVPDGDTVLLTCVANGDLPLSISWSREGTVLMNDSQRITIYEEEIEEGGITFIQSILQICSIGSDDAGVYNCIAENDASNDTASFELTVAGPPVQIVLNPVDPTNVPDGDTVLLTCVANGDLPLSISWSREGTVLMNDSQRITIYEEEIEEGRITFLQSILQICSARADDAGTYSCIAENEAGNDTANFQLTVVPPEVAVQIVLHPVDLTDVPDGDTVLLTCVANGDLPLSISWSREGTVLMNDSQRITIYEEEIEEGGITFIQSILQICSIGSDDAGVYNCIAENDASNDTASFELTVAGPPVQIVLNPVDPTNVPDGDTVLLTCVANGDLPLSISWSREGTVLMNDSQRITIYEEEIEEGGITFLQSILQICSARADDAGTYSCVAENEAGNDTANFELTVIPPEVAVQIVLHPVDPTNVPDGDTVLLTCVANGDLPLSISWSREGTVLMNDSQRITIYEEEIEEGGITFVQSVLQVCSIGTSDAGIYSCIAENGASNDTANFELTVAVPVVAVQIVLHPVDPTDVPVGDTVLLTCVANGDLPLSISWSREGTVLMNDSQRITIYDEEIEEGGITFVQSVLQICSAETDDAGSYSCNADNTAGNDTASFELTVSEDEFATVVIRPTDTEVVAGLTALLTCVGYGNPPVSITWRRFDTVLTNDTSPRITIYEQEIIEGGVVFVMSILQICSAEVADTGLASCTVDNGVANDTTEFQFTVEPAVPQLVITPENLTEVSSGNTVFLTCVALGELPLAFRWTREGSDLMNDTRVFVYDEAFEEGGSSFVQSILQICSTEEPDSGMYSCVAENEQGNATAVFELDVLVSPVIVIQPPPLTDVPDGNTILLTCVAYGELPLGISWSREGSLLMNDSQRIVIYKEEFEEGGITFVQSVIQICSAEVDDAGVYNCTAENEVDSVTASFELTVTPLVIPLQIVIQPEPTTDVVVGETVLFTCVATGDLPLSISWSREGSVLQNDSQRVAIYEEEFDENGIVFVQSILQICNTGTGDAGIYSCTAENETANITASFELTVSVEAQLVLVPPDSEVPSGDTILLTCVASGSLPLEVSWSREGSALMNDTRVVIYQEAFEESGLTFVRSILQLCSAETADSGTYSCTANNGFSNDSATFDLAVMEVTPQIVLIPPNTQVNATNTVLLTCVAYGGLPLGISWSREGSNLVNDSQRITIYEEQFEENGVTFVRSILQICSTEIDDSGVYSCTAENNAGNITSAFELAVTIPARVVALPNDTEVNAGDTLLLTCVGYSHPVGTIIWSRGSVDLANGTRTTIYEEEFEESGLTFVRSILQICSTEPSDAGLYTCTVDNGITDASSNFNVAVITQAPVIVLAPNDTIVTAGFSVALTCAAYGIPAPEISWTRQDLMGISLLEDTNTTNITSERFEEGGVTFVQSTLFLCSSEVLFTAELSCTAANSVGSDTEYFTVSVESAVTIVHNPEPTSGHVGQSASLTCTVMSSQSPSSFQWYRVGMEDPIAVGDRYEISRSDADSMYTSQLTISDLVPADGGEYFCEVVTFIHSVQFNVTTVSALLTILRVPVVEAVSVSPVLGIKGLSTTLQFSVSADALPPVTPANVEWRFNPISGPVVTLTESSSVRYTFSADMLSLTITGLASADEGTYTLIASTVAGSDSAAIHMFVRVPARITTPPVNMQAHVGSSAAFTCVAEGDPVPTFQWSFDGLTLADNDKYDITTTSTMSILTVLEISSSDGGSYTCNATNDYGTNSASAELQVRSVPVVAAVSISPLIRAQNTSVTLQFSISDDLPPVTSTDVVWRFTPVGSSIMQTITSDGRYIFSDDTLSLTIGELVVSDEGSYSLEATTTAGSDSATIFLDVQTATVITTPPEDTQALVGRSATFTCVAEAEPTPTFQWEFEGSTVVASDKYSITATTSTVSTLTVLDISPSDDGAYTCNATNDHGSDFASADLQVLSVPVVAAVSSSPLIGTQETSVTLQFSISDDLPPVTSTDIVWRFTPVGSSTMQGITSDSNIRYTFSDDMLSLTIETLIATDEGSYTLEATNIAGSDSATIFLNVQTAVMITTPPEDTQGLIGSSATFTCVAEAEPAPTFQWSFESSTIVDDDKYDVTTTSTMSTLTVLNISPSDNGTYTCNATNDHGTDFASADLQVHSVPTVAFSNSPVIGALGTTVTLQFSISDDLPPVISSGIVWQFTPVGSSAMQPITSSGRYTFSDDMLSLTIGTLIAVDEGSYTLEATTIAGSDSATIFLDVQTATVITAPPEDTQALVGRSATFTCVAEAEPTPTFQWSFEGSTIVASDKYSITATTSTVSMLTVLDISPSDDGTYTCSATNDHGSDFASADLQVLSVPVVAAVSSSPLIGTQETSVTLQFSISDDLPPVTSTDIVWRFTPVGSSTMQGITSDSNIRYTFSDDMLSLTIETLIATDEGSYTLEATNIAGSDSATIFLNVQTAVMITTPPEDTQGLIGSSATFTCVAEAEPAPTFQWSFESSTIVDDDKYDVTTTSTMSTLTVLNISPSDNGTYTCNATNDHGTDFASADLQVLSVPTVAFSNSPVIGALGTTVTLQFSLSDDLPPVISSGIVWQFTPVGSSAMQPITSSGRYTFSDDMFSLTIGTLIAVDEGSYTLEATTIAGSDSATIFLDVQTATVITAPPEDTQALVGRSATFTCVAEAEPTPTFQWSFEGLTITDDDKYDITTTSTMSTLTVLEISLSDDGTYTCNATNDHGSDFASADLQALTVPVVTAVSSNPLIGAQNTSVTLQFSISNDLPPVTSTDVVWRFTPFGSSVMQTITSDGRYIFSDDMLSLAIEALIATDEGSYTLEATTIAGSDSATIVLDVQTATVITIPPEDTQALVGRSATFTCVAEAEPTPTFQWEFEGVVIMDVDRYDIDTTSTESALTISDVVASDDGTYTCSAENVHGRDFASANLQVLSIPVVSAVSQSPLIGILERNITLQFSEGNDLPPITPADIEWRFAPIGGSAITISSSPDSHYIFSDDKLSLTIIVLSLDDEGVYELMGTTIAGSTSANISLDVQVPARITAPPVYTEVIVGRSATLSCVVAAEPAPAIQWSFGGSALVESNKYEITVTNSSSTLTILDVSTSDDGVYTCDVTNVHGTDSASAELEVLVPPTVSVIGSGLFQATEGQTITLSFLIINSNPPVSPSDITWEFLFISDTAETVIIDDGTRYTFSPDRTSLTIANLGPMDSGTYTLTAINSAGSSATFIQLSVSVSPTIFEDGGDTSVLDVGEEVTFVCTADGVPLPTSIVWLKNNRLLQTEQNDRFKVVEEEVPPFQPYILSARRSTLVVTDLRTSDGGTYSCSASNGIGTAVLPQAYGLTVTEPEPINFCASSPCQNGGTCSNLEANFVCMCPTGRDGLTCETRVTVSDPPVIVAGPLTLFVLPFTPAFLACTISGTPQPVITWFKDGILIPREGSQTLVIPEPGLSDRGLYYCSATNSLGTVSSPPVYLNIIGIVQFLFSIRIDISALFPLRADGNLNEVEEKLVELLNQLDGASLGDNITLYSVETLEGATINPITGAVDIVITVFSDDGANTTVRTVDDEVLGELSVLLEDLGREQNITFTVTGMKRFDGCSAEATVIRSDSSSELDLRLQWPEMPIGAVASISCPCESADIPRMATRICGGDFESGGQWEDPADNDCDFGDFTRRLCLVTGDPTSTIAAVAEITGDPTSFGALEISTTLELLEQLLTRATGNASLSNGLFDVIDNLLKVSPENLLESHERTNSSARLRAMLEHLADTYPLPSGLQDLRPSFTITRDTFAMRIHLVHPDTFTGDALSVMFQDSFYLVDAFQQNDLVTGIDEDAAAYISLPTSLFEGLNLGTDEARLVYDVYLKDTLFMRRSNYVEEQALVNEVGGIVMSGRISSGVQVSNLEEQVQLSFAKNPFARSGINTQCSFWDQSLDEGYGAWSTEGCLRVRDSSGRTDCQCNHLTSFTILAEPAAVNEGLGSIVGLIGGPVCIFFLLLTVIKYLFIRSLRSTTIGVFLFNICLALTVLYAFTIASFYTTSSEVLCAVFSSLFHWLFLVSALALTTAAIFRVWEPNPGRKRWLIFILTIILSWVVPAIVVVVSVAPDYKNYTDDQFCRPSYLPYWLGLILPWGILHVIAYILVFLAFCKSQPINTSASSNEKTTWMREQTGLLLAIVSFDIAWGFGLPTLQYSETLDNSMRSAFQIVFIVFSILLGVVVFLFFCLLSRTVRNKIIQLFGNAIPGKSKTYSPQAFTDQHPVEENVYEMAAKPETKGESPASPASMDEKPTFAAYILSNPMTEEDNHDGANGVGGEDREKGVESSPEFEEEFTKF